MHLKKKETTAPICNKLTITSEFGKLIKHKRKSLNKTLLEASEMCDISDRTLRKLESGAIGSRLSTALNVANILGININYKL